MTALYRTFRTAINALRRNILRSVLTTLGIVIGIAAVIAMMEIGQGSTKAIEKTIQSMGADNFVVRAGVASSGGVTFGAESVNTLLPEDAEAIRRECPAVRQVAPLIRTRIRVVYANRNWDPGFIYGTTPSFLDVRDWGMAEGEVFDDRDVRGMNKVCVLGQTVVRELFGDESPVGKEVRIASVSLRVLGVLERKGANMMGMDQDDFVMVPWTTVKYRLNNKSMATTQTEQQAATTATATPQQQVNTLNRLYPNEILKLYPEKSPSQVANYPQSMRSDNIDQIYVASHTPADIPLATQQVNDLLRVRHRIKPGQPDDFYVRNMAESARALSQTTELSMRLLLFVALVSLVVGGVGIMNIMLVSVTERTREIGLRMAVGARSRDILRQFLVEALLLCLLGGLIGILLGRGGSILMRELLGWPTLLSLPAIIASVAVSATVGIVFGFYPAWKASRLDPIQALRYE